MNVSQDAGCSPMSDESVVPGFGTKAWTAWHPAWTGERRWILREKRRRSMHANRRVAERKPELPSLPDDGSELFNRSP
jgi:hypothetical protein